MDLVPARSLQAHREDFAGPGLCLTLRWQVV